MNPPETKFVLRAHRADGRYKADDPLFGEALAEADRSPALAAWLAHEHALDATIANKLDGIPPPAGLRESILAGARASRLARRWWSHPTWFAAAAGIAVTISLSIPVVWRALHAPEVSAGSFVHLAIGHCSQQPHHHAYAPPLAAVATALGARAVPLTAGLDLTPETLRKANCAALQLGGRDAYEICFERDGAWFHLYVTKLDRRGATGDDRKPVFMQHDQLAAAAWTDGDRLYSVVTRAGPEALAKIV